MLDWEAGESTARVIIVLGVAKEGREERLRDCSHDIGEFHAMSLQILCFDVLVGNTRS
jgi:hypothetical protein